ncbi:hypothetical protein CONCODRAFT_12744 [Conidiobolus coronatus NRRL 28638]|uniref:Uncharacterized protein n=1 Tax=Conidiobolus coronatus (strain ATCC 28846 / CBS 209.66 / NRRL 28638) TaxID=796925 RepID=A0A137NS68_CONC2|nr:hypothetical protein CONCODRAFT_12744 [Conidiobolus coronatus NRRL 28638]|eukprot:KXN65609.1 hypothetical protein CONCODRAFT_12744 [Conidiobolus coronatus NRRL 28638]
MYKAYSSKPKRYYKLNLVKDPNRYRCNLCNKYNPTYRGVSSHPLMLDLSESISI